jgi:hypothetical protein
LKASQALTHTFTELQAVVKECGSVRAAADKLGVPRSTLQDRLYKGCATQGPAAVRKMVASSVPSVREVSPGLSLSLDGVRVADSKPADSVKRKIYMLRKGRGFPLDALADEWNVSSSTLRSHARRLGAFKYVQTTPGNWVPCVIHPDTVETLVKRGE